MPVIKSFIIVLLILFLSSCKNSTPTFYGEAFDTTKVIAVSELMKEIENQKQVSVIVTGTISSSCQDDGCWLNLENPDGGEVYVEWDEKFHLPLDISGKTVMMNGYAYIDSSKEGNPIAIKASGVKL